MALIHVFPLSQNFSLPHNLPKYPIKRSPLPDHKYGQFRRFASIPTSYLQVERQSANYQPSLWSYDFLQSLNSDYADQRYKDRAKKLEEDVRSMITNENADLLATLELIDDLQRLGLGYRFERDIIRALDNFASSKFCDERIQKSLHATALSFRLLRQQGYQVSQDVFNSFEDHSGNFKECLRKDVKGMLSLYEASYLAFEGENILEEARAFTRMHLKDLKGDVSKSMAEQVSHALEVPLHRRMQRLEARWYIEAYNKREGANSLILELAKLDFNIVQSVFQRELKDMSRWDVNAVKNLPHHMKLCFLALYNTINEMVYDTLKEKGENILPYLTKAWADLCKAFLQEAKWCYNKDMPIFKDYLDNGWVSVSGAVFIVHAYFFLNQKFTKQALEGLEKYDDLLRWPSVIFRLCNDLSTSAGELKRGETANSIHCYMRETGVSEEVAEKHIHNMIDRTWKKMNEERVVDSPFGEGLAVRAINLARIAQCTYQYGDGHGAPDTRAKNRVLSLIIEPVSLIER
ncbi:tricyclene synthase TPS4, chloroplastic-like isoform X2 [Alnus glutinosa]|uniref:tricyclene synthase TPS4, chloroplastic-like isoform X2 n=1 Tax=Alnus glutinosa TaxID=3517 RepID=UPI002D7927C8|nr:tricyclene synthase TPS4, chloroplastic-like isoform X2 [Alnus glutinosa]